MVDEKKESPEVFQIILKIPSHVNKQDLLDLKVFLQENGGEISVWIQLKNQNIDTKLGISKEPLLRSWCEKRW